MLPLPVAVAWQAPGVSSLHAFETRKSQILDRVDILDLVSEHVSLKQRGPRWVGLCPFHSEKTPSFTVRPDMGFFKCFGCGKGGDVFSFVQFRENVSFVESMRMLADRAGVEMGDAGQTDASGPSRADVARVNAWAMKFFQGQLLNPQVGRSAREYVAGRKISDEMVERFGIGLATGESPGLQEAAARAGIANTLLVEADLLRRGESGDLYETFRNRLMFPIRDATNRVVGFGGRTLGDDRAKYLNTRQNLLFDKGRGLYGIDLARQVMSDRGRVVVVEGYTDVVACHQAGFTEAVATLGTAMTEMQVDLLRRYTDRIILLFDSDEAGTAAADRAIQVALPRCVAVQLARIPDGKDPSEFLGRGGVEDFSDVLNGAVDALEFKWTQTRRRFQGGQRDGQRREAVMDFLRVVAGGIDTNAVDAIQRGLLVNQVAHLLRMDRGEVDRMMTRLRSRRESRPATEQAPAVAVRPVAERGAEQAAWTTLLEVLLNEPGVLADLDDLPDVGRIVDERDQRIAAVVRSLFAELGEFRLADVLARLNDPLEVERVMVLAHRGAERGNYEQTFGVNVERIRSALQEVSAERRHADLVAESGGVVSAEQDRIRLESIGQEARKRRGFAPRRHVRREMGT